MIALDDYANLMPLIDRLETGQARFLGNLLCDTLKLSAVVDWGCASGLYLTPFEARGVEILGIDAEPTAGALIPGKFLCKDIRQPLHLNAYFSLALCIEVAEHLQPEYADALLDNIAASAELLFWSAATPGQGGQNHHNEQWASYWDRKLAARGFIVHPMNTFIRSRIAENPECRKVGWLVKNARLFTK